MLIVVRAVNFGMSSIAFLDYYTTRSLPSAFRSATQQSGKMVSSCYGHQLSLRPDTMALQPQRVPPKAYQILVKTHQVTVFLTVPHSATIAMLKDEALSALTSRVATQDESLPHVNSTSEFELARAVKEKEKSRSGVTYEVLEPDKSIRSLLANWEVLYFQFRDEESESTTCCLAFLVVLQLDLNGCQGNLMPVEVSQPSLIDDEEDEPPVNKGKRKAPSE